MPETQDPAQIRWIIARAHQYQADAYTARQDAHQIQAELESLRPCLEPLKNLHTIQIWDSRAATFSRQRLHTDHTSALNSLLHLLEDKAAELMAYAYLFESNAENFFDLLKR